MPVLPPLTYDSICDAIDQTCAFLNNNDRGGAASSNEQVRGGWKLRRAVTQDFAAKSAGDGVVVDEKLLFGIVSSSSSGPDILTTAYFAYSTWNGRFLYLDDPGTTLENDNDTGLPLLLRRAWADIAVRLHCDRFTWQHYENDSNVKYYSGTTVHQPETLHGWLTLHWTSEAMEKILFAKQPNNGWHIKKQPSPGQRPLLSNDMIRETITMCLREHSDDKLNLKLATEQDLDSIGRLVQGLADFEKEPDAVKVSLEHYRRDGFEDRPCFHCVMLNQIGKDKKVYSFGMAFCYIGFTLSGGLFLYLEDLYIEEPYRGKGAGSTVMKALASIAYSLGCSRLVWQALDWNTKALTFYGKLGAKVKEGLLTTRFAEQSLKSFVNEMRETDNCIN